MNLGFRGYFFLITLWLNLSHVKRKSLGLSVYTLAVIVCPRLAHVSSHPNINKNVHVHVHCFYATQAVSVN